MRIRFTKSKNYEFDNSETARRAFEGFSLFAVYGASGGYYLDISKYIGCLCLGRFAIGYFALDVTEAANYMAQDLRLLESKETSHD